MTEEENVKLRIWIDIRRGLVDCDSLMIAFIGTGLIYVSFGWPW